MLQTIFRAVQLFPAALLMILITSSPVMAQDANNNGVAGTNGNGVAVTDLPSATSDLLSAVDGEDSDEASFPETGVDPSVANEISEGAPPYLAPQYGLDILKAFGMFIVVLALLFLTLKLIGRLGRFRIQKSRDSIFDMRGILPLDNRKYLAAIEIEGRMLVVGVTQDRIIPVADWSAGKDFPSGAEGDFTFKLHEEEDFPPDISVADGRGGGTK